MNRGKILLIVLLVILAMMVVFKQPLPAPRQNSAGPTPSVSLYNPPKEIKYDSSTDLEKELDSITPQVLDEDFI